jgi:hypothetical protein
MNSFDLIEKLFKNNIRNVNKLVENFKYKIAEIDTPAIKKNMKPKFLKLMKLLEKLLLKKLWMKEITSQV